MDITTINHRPLREEKALLERYKTRMGSTMRVHNLRDEAALWNLLKAPAESSSYLVVMDETGEDATSEQVAHKLKYLREIEEVRLIRFVIGPSEGCSKALKGRADWLWRFGKVTWAHHLMQVMLAEQLYRVSTILSGHPYHRSANEKE